VVHLEKTQRRGKMGKVIGGIIVAILIAVLLVRCGILGFGGSGDSKSGSSEEQSEIIEETEEITITIVVTQDEYFIDEQKVTLTQIKERVTDESAEIKVILEDNYASAKAWDDIKAYLAEWEIVPIEQ
jgi:hypothetical protein